YGFTAMLINLLRDEAPTHLAVAFDVSRVTFRSERFAEYKANRSSTPDDFRGQVDLIKDVLSALAIPFFAVENFEADDIIATLATQAEAQGYRVLITTGDRDAFQLVSDNVTVLYPTRGVSELGRIDPDAVMARYGLTPAQYPDFAALRGDPSDNLPSIPGVGEKTAAKWVREFGSLEELTDRVDQVKGKAGDALRANLAHVLLNRQLTELIRDVPLEAAPDDLTVRAWDREAVHRLFDDLEFRVLRERLFATLTSAEPEAEEGFEVEGATLAPGTVRAWLDAHARDGRRVGVVVHGKLGTWAGRDVEGIALAAGEPSLEARAAGASAGTAQAAYLDVQTLLPDDEAALGEWLADPAVPKAAHDVKAALHGLRARGWNLDGLTSDTALAAYLALPGQGGGFDLGDLALRYLRRELRADTGPTGPDGQLTLDGGEEEKDEQVAYDTVLHARAVADLAVALDQDLERRGGTALLRDLELPLVRVLADCERTGIAADVEHLSALETRLRDQVKDAAEQAYAAVGHEFHLGSPKQLQALLFDELGLPKTKKIKTGWTTDADSLQNLLGTHPVIEALLLHREMTRLLMVVEKQLLPTVADDGRIHTTFKQMVAATGRLSSDNPNLQNVPIRTAQGREIRQGFVSGPGFESLMTADYSQIEMRIMAHLSGDEGLIEAFRSGEDLHSFVGSRVFGVPPAEVSSAMRSKIKAMSYGLAYGLSAFGLSRQLRVPTEEARALMDEYFDRFGGVRDYLRSIVDEARRTGYTETILGRRRYLPDLTSDNRQ
ncbi:MAG TPA: DNA polymerase I, partial [Actinomycetales bacterium]